MASRTSRQLSRQTAARTRPSTSGEKVPNCKATGACIYRMDVEMACPRRDELSARLHADAVARKKVKAKAKQEYNAAHPRVKEPTPALLTREQQIAATLKAWPEDAPSDYSDLF